MIWFFEERDMRTKNIGFRYLRKQQTAIYGQIWGAVVCLNHGLALIGLVFADVRMLWNGVMRLVERSVVTIRNVIYM